MYHFIRRCFVLVLVLAFGFSFLLCRFVHTGCCQIPSGFPTPYDYIYTREFGEVTATTYWAAAVSQVVVISKNPYDRSNSTSQFPQGGWNLTSVPTYTLVADQLPFNRTDFALRDDNMQYIPTMQPQDYSNSVTIIGPYGYAATGTDNIKYTPYYTAYPIFHNITETMKFGIKSYHYGGTYAYWLPVPCPYCWYYDDGMSAYEVSEGGHIMTE